MSRVRIRVAGIGREVGAGLLVTLLLTTQSACKLDNATPGPLTGPSELGMSLQLTAVPDTLTRDGASTSVITLRARGPNGEPLGNVNARIEVCPFGDFNGDGVAELNCFKLGTLSQDRIVTDATGSTSFMYTAPSPPASSLQPGSQAIAVFIRVTPESGDLGSVLSREVSIGLIPPGGQAAPSVSAPVAAFKITPATPTQGQPVQFDASTSKDNAAAAAGANSTITSYSWDFGDGTPGSGQIATHTYRAAGAFVVTLTVSNGVQAGSAREAVTVSDAAKPTASFVFTPADPAPNQVVFFNAAESVAAAGRTLVSYLWTFSNGKTGTGVTHTRKFPNRGAIDVTVEVTDDLGLKDTASQIMTITTPDPTAAFVISPTAPEKGQTVFFNASQSTAVGAATIVSYRWDFGDSTTILTCPSTNAACGTGSDVALVTHNYGAAVEGTFTVVLTVTDSEGRTGQNVQTVTVKDPA